VEHLYALLYSFLPTAANMEPEADRYLLLLNVRVKRLLPVYFHILSVYFLFTSLFMVNQVPMLF
jgi:hypothetical protein